MDGSAIAPGCFGDLLVYRAPPKPRSRGITVASDRGLSHEGTKSFIEVASDIVDHIKMPDHYGLISRYSEQWLKTKIALYHDAGISTTLGGALYEVAVVQGKTRQFMDRVAELGFSGIEVSEDIIDPQPAEQRAADVRYGNSLGLFVFTELGRKFPEKPFDADEAAAIGQRDLDAGAALIVIENSDIISTMKNGRDSLHRLAERLPMEKLIFEAGPNERMEVAKWLLAEFGPQVNIENIEVDDAAAIAAMRAGLHRKVDFSFFSSPMARPGGR